MSETVFSIQDLLARQRSEYIGFRTRPFIPRARESQLRGYLESSLIKVVIGPRRAGKSRLIQKVLENSSAAYINFEDEQIRKAPGDEILDAAKEIYPQADYWYLDEVQDYPEWETLINKMHRRNFNLVITGSNSKLLSSEFATRLTGRHVAIELLPFSYGEFTAAKGAPRTWETFESYLHTGGFPEVLLESHVDSRTYLSTLFDSVVLKDVVKRKRLRNPNYLLNCLTLMVDNIAARTSARALSRALQNSPSYLTVEKYIEMAGEAYLLEVLSAYRVKTKERIQSERKPYMMDTGLIEAVSRHNMPLLGKQLENAVFLELRRRGHVPNRDLFYYRSKEGQEVDFLIRSGHETSELIQVCLDISGIETKNREVRAMTAAAKEYPNAAMTIVTGNETGIIKLSEGNRIALVAAYDYCG